MMRLSMLLATIGLATSLAAQGPVAPSTARGEWPTYGGDLASSKYSPLDQINASNFGSLKTVWRAKSPDGFLSLTLPDGTEWSADSKTIFDELNRLDPKRWRDGQPPFVQNYKATPLMVNGTLYVNTPSSVGAAYDARTGALKWVYNPKSYEAGTTTLTLRWNQRGVAYWTDGKDERIYWGTGDGYLIAVDARTGKPVAGYEARIVDDDMNELPDGTIGKLAVRGPTGCRYLADNRQANYVRDGWNLTGDSFVRDAHGRLSFVARSDDMIVSSGYNIAGPEVEAALLAHPAVAECGVVGAPDEARGLIVKAYVVLAGGARGDAALTTALQDHVKREIAPYKYPRAIEYVDALPKTETGKLRRFALRQIAAAGATSPDVAAE